MQGVDYSFSRPDIDCLWQQGYRFVVRYTSNGTSRKNATRAEVDALKARGFQVAIVHQNGTSDMLQGRDKGIRDATYARDKTAALGMPSNRPIYFALDQDPNPLSNAQIDACKAYLDGAASVLGRSRVGLYAGYRGIELLCPTHAPWGWQTYAWSGGRISGKAHFRQYRNGVSRCGGDVDLNETYKPDVGQWPIESQEDDMTPEQAKQLEAVAEKVHQIAVSCVPFYQDNQPKDGRFQVQTLVKRALAGVRFSTDLDEAQIAALVIASLDPTAIAAAIPDDIAERVANELAQRLSA